MKTIKQLADELGVSKTAIRNYMDADFREKYTEKDSKGVITITPDGCKVLSENIGKQTENTAKNSPETEICTMPASVLKTLQDQLAAKDQQIATLEQLLDQEQRLHAGAQKISLPEGNAGAAIEAPGPSETVPDEVELLKGFLKDAKKEIELLNAEKAQKQEEVVRNLSLWKILRMKTKKGT